MAVIGVTGAGGFIGSAVVRRLLRDGHTIRAALGPPDASVHDPGPNVQQSRFEIGDADAVRAFVDGCDAIVHAAGPPSVAWSFAHPLETVRVHTLGTANVLDAARIAGVARFIYLSSAEVYGRPQSERVREDHPFQPRSPYGAAKAAAEMLIRGFEGTFGIRATILRPFSIYGEGMAGSSLLREIVEQARAGDEIVLNDLAPVRDYCYVDDLTDAVARACTSAHASTLALNVGTGIGTSVLDLARAAATILGRNAIVRERSGAKRGDGREIYHLLADPSLAERELGWKASYTLERGLRAMLREHRYA